MKKCLLSLLSLLIITGFNPLLAQQTETPKDTVKPVEKKVEKKKKQQEDKFIEEIPEFRKYYKEQYDLIIDAPFESVFKAVKQAIAEVSCMIQKDSYAQDKDGLYKGYIRSDYCVFVDGEDSTFTFLERYSYEDMPIIRGGIWTNGRILYKINMKEQTDGKVALVMKSEMSGFERHVTDQVHFWNSNGKLEMDMLDRVQKNIDKIKQQ